MIRMTVVAVALFVAAGRTIAASEIDEAIALKNETMETFRTNAGKPVVPEVYADAIRKLIRAEELLEKAALTDPQRAEPLQQEVASQRFWAQRFANVNVADALRNGKTSQPDKKPDVPAAPATPRPPVAADTPPAKKIPPLGAGPGFFTLPDRAMKVAEELNKEAALLGRQGKDAEAAELLLRTIRASPSKDMKKIAVLAEFFHSIWHYKASIEFYKLLEEDLEKRLGPNDALVAFDLKKMAEAATAMGQDKEAEALLQRVLAIEQKFYGPEHLEVAETISRIGVCYIEFSKFDLAQTWLNRALAMREKLADPKSPVLAYSYGCLGLLYLRQNKFPQAEVYYRKCLAILEAAYGPRDSRLCQALGSVANTLAANKPDEAESLLKRALQISEASNGPDNAAMGGLWHSLGNIYYFKGALPKAKEAYEKSVAINEKRLGAESGDVAGTLANLGNIYAGMKDYPRAEATYDRALKIYLKLYGEVHSTVAMQYGNLAVALLLQDKLAPAEATFRRAMDLNLRIFGEKDGRAIQSIYNVGNCLLSAEKYEESLKYFERSLALADKYMAPGNGQIRWILTQYSISLNKLGRTAEAAKLDARVRTFVETERRP